MSPFAALRNPRADATSWRRARHPTMSYDRRHVFFRCNPRNDVDEIIGRHVIGGELVERLEI
jgi:hypothetical protein